MSFFITIAIAVALMTSKWFWLGWGLLIFAICRPRCHGRKVKESWFEKNGVSVPKSQRAHRAVRQLQSLYKTNRRKYPSLESHYDEILESLWQTLRQTPKTDDWIRLVEAVIENWPIPKRASANPSRIWDKIEETKRAATDLQDSINEAWGRA